jgi:hypothetical protein
MLCRTMQSLVVAVLTMGYMSTDTYGDYCLYGCVSAGIAPVWPHIPCCVLLDDLRMQCLAKVANIHVQQLLCWHMVVPAGLMTFFMMLQSRSRSTPCLVMQSISAG